MFGLIYEADQVSWTGEDERTRYGAVITLSDDAVWAEVQEIGQDDIVQLPTSILHPIT